MQLSTNDRSETIRMEDVVFTLNNIVDEITSMYADSFDHPALDDSSMEIDPTQRSLSESGSKEDIISSARPDSPTLSEPPLSAISTGNSDSEDGISLYSDSLEPSPTSSGFTTPSQSPTSFTFITDKDIANPGTAISHPMVEDERPPFVSDNIQVDTPSSRGCSPRMNTESTAALKVEPPKAASISAFEVQSIKIEPDPDSKPFSWTPSLSPDSGSRTSSSTSLSSAQDNVEIIYQTSNNPSVFLTTPSAHMPGVNPPHLTMAPPRLPPRPKHPRDSPPHLPALRSPTLQLTPKLDQNEDWDTTSRIKRNGLGAAHLARQRQWARMTITHASSLAEPENLPPCRPVDKYLEWSSYSSSLASPPRRRNLGAMGRRVHLGPRTLPRGDWDPERRGGAIDRWNHREVLRRERTRPYGSADQASRPKLKPVVPLRIDTSKDYRKNSVECEIQQDGVGGDNVLVSSTCETNSTQENEESQKDHNTTEGNQDTMRLCVKDGKRVPPGPPTSAPNTDSGPQSPPGSSESTATLSTSSSPVDNPNMMRWCVKDGVRVSPETEVPAVDPSSKPEADSGADAPNSVTRGTSTAIANPQTTTTLFDQSRVDAECPYVPKKKSPLSRALLPVSPSTMKFQLRAPGDALSIGKARRKFASMMF